MVLGGKIQNTTFNYCRLAVQTTSILEKYNSNITNVEPRMTFLSFQAHRY
jgi:hypothetical protein